MTKTKKKFKSQARTEPAPQVVVTSDTLKAKPKRWSTPAITATTAAITIFVLGIIVFFTGLTSPFMGDDTNQIVNNLPVHSINNVGYFFEGSTFYNGRGLSAPLSGNYYRPIMVLVFSFIYSFFGPHSVAFHLVQLGIYAASAFLLFLVFRYVFKPTVALILALIFLVHPLNSQVAFAIPSMQDALCFFFGILALWLLMKFKSQKSMLAVAASLLLSMLSKEVAIVFVIMSLLYLAWFNKERLKVYVGIMILPIALYLALRIHALGLYQSTDLAPIDHLNFAGRLLTAPSIIAFYVTKFVFAWHLSSGYFWTYPVFSVQHVMLPLAFDLAVVCLLAYLAHLIRKTASKTQYAMYVFFAIWAALGLLPYLQIIPLDMTASETWFYISMAGVLGMIGVVVEAFRLRPRTLLIMGLIIVGLFGVRTSIRGINWDNPSTLAADDIAASPQDYYAYNNIAEDLITNYDYSQAKPYVIRSISIFPTYSNYCSLGEILVGQGNYAAAQQAYRTGLKYGDDVVIYENLGGLTLLYGNPISDGHFFKTAIGKFPGDYKLWMYLALLQEEYKNNNAAQGAITNAMQDGPVPEAVYSNIMNDQPFTLSLPGTGRAIKEP